MSKIMVMATLRLHNEALLEAWKELSSKITADLQGVKGFISRDSVRSEDGLIYCILKWESRADQEAFMEAFMARPDANALMQEFGEIVDVQSMTREYFDIL